MIEDFSAGYENRPTSDLLSAILNQSGYETMLRTEGSQERLDNLAELKQSIREYEDTCGEEATTLHYLAHVALFTNSDADDDSDKVRLMTVHAAKGLEFPYVFLCGMNEGIFPSPENKRPQRHGGGTAASICRHDPRPKASVPIKRRGKKSRRLAAIPFPLCTGYRP